MKMWRCLVGGLVCCLIASEALLTERLEQVAKLTASDAAAADEFGWSVAIEGNTVVIGARFEKSNTGAVYVFRTSEGATYDQVAKLTTADAAADHFGRSVLGGDQWRPRRDRGWHV